MTFELKDRVLFKETKNLLKIGTLVKEYEKYFWVELIYPEYSKCVLIEKNRLEKIISIMDYKDVLKKI